MLQHEVSTGGLPQPPPRGLPSSNSVSSASSCETSPHAPGDGAIVDLREFIRDGWFQAQGRQPAVPHVCCPTAPAVHSHIHLYCWGHSPFSPHPHGGDAFQPVRTHGDSPVDAEQLQQMAVSHRHVLLLTKGGDLYEAGERCTPTSARTTTLTVPSLITSFARWVLCHVSPAGLLTRGTERRHSTTVASPTSHADAAMPRRARRTGGCTRGER